ncbi:hypothetical protein IWQ56_005367, partial [Coemansia nantahalensis]
PWRHHDVGRQPGAHQRPRHVHPGHAERGQQVQRQQRKRRQRRRRQQRQRPGVCGEHHSWRRIALCYRAQPGRGPVDDGHPQLRHVL